MGSHTDRKKSLILPSKLEKSQKTPIKVIDNSKEDLENIIDENLITLKKVHSILLNCINLTKKQKLEFAESERYFMKQYLKKITEKIENNK